MGIFDTSIFKRKSPIEDDGLTNYEICIPEPVRIIINLFELELEKSGLNNSIVNDVLSEFFSENISGSHSDELIINLAAYLELIFNNASEEVIYRLITVLATIYSAKNFAFMINNEKIIELTHFIYFSQIELTKITAKPDNSFSKKGIDVRHAENRAAKSDVFKWLDKNMHNYRSMDKAAEAIAGKEVPFSFRTVRDWIAEWKKQRSAGKA